MSKNVDAAELIEGIKTPTSKWVKTKSSKLRNFYWQGGYGVFSVSPTNLDRVKRYILGQEDHHKKISFQDEFRNFLKRYQIKYDERFVWE
jgi:hypothetical protein